MALSYSELRTNFNNNFPDALVEFPIEATFKKLLTKNNIKAVINPIQIPLINDFRFQRLLSFKIDIFDQLPLRPDIGFDLAWRTFEAYCVYFSTQKQWSTERIHKILDKVVEDILEIQFHNNTNLTDCMEKLLSSIPLQTTEFLASRLFDHNDTSIKTQQKKIREIVENILGAEIFDAIESKYLPLNASNQRDAGLLFQKIVGGETFKLNSKKTYKLTLKDRLKILISGILYSYRNERSHGDAFSPLRSSKTTMRTYAHCYFCLNAVYFFLSQLMAEHYPTIFNLNIISNSLNQNIDAFALLFNKWRKK